MICHIFGMVVISTIFCIDKKSKSMQRVIVAKWLGSVFWKNFVRYTFLRYAIVKILINHQTEIAKRLHAPMGDRIILVLDRTYIFIQKSSNFAFQRIWYSGHKHRKLIKPMMAVCTDGYIADVWGPYPGSKNDASILNEFLQKDMWSQLEAGGIFLVDCNFRNSITEISGRGYIPRWLHFRTNDDRT